MSDHMGLFVDIETSSLFGASDLMKGKKERRVLHEGDEAKVKEYLKLLTEELDKMKVFEKVQELETAWVDKTRP